MSLLEKSFEKEKYKATHLVDEEHEGLRLDQFLQMHLLSFSRQAIKKKIKDGEILIHGRTPPHRPSAKLHHKDIVTIITINTVHEDEYWRKEKIELETTPETIFEDDNLIVITKPPFMSTHPTGKHLFNCATVHFESIFKKTIHSIHRLDRETSGILLLGKNPKATREFTTQFENGKVRKCYFFISVIDNETFQDQDEFEADQRLGNDNEGLERVYINHYPSNDTRGKKAKTKFNILFKNEKYALGLAFPQTGRQHQIRVHAACKGLPLLGDKLYLGNFPMFQRFKDNIATCSDHDLMQIPRHALHATAINIPFYGEDRIFQSKIPNDLLDWIRDNIKIDINKLEIEIRETIKEYFK